MAEVSQVVAVAQAQGATPVIAEPADRLYVAPDGDDSASGEESAPLATLEEAASRFPGGGTVIVRSGVYPQQSWFDAAGEEGIPLYIRAADGETPIFDGTEIQSEWPSSPWLRLPTSCSRGSR